MKECVFLSNNQDGTIENYWMMHFLNVTDVLTDRVNCSGSTFNLTLFWRVVRDLRVLWSSHIFTHDRYNILSDILTEFEVNLGIIIENMPKPEVFPCAYLYNSLKICWIKMICKNYNNPRGVSLKSAWWFIRRRLKCVFYKFLY